MADHALAVPLTSPGPGTAGTVVMIHGLAASGLSWRGFAAALPGDRGWLAVDLPGHGRSPHLDSYSFGGLAHDVARVCAGLPGPLTVVGHSLGGAVALLLGTGLFGVAPAAVVALDSKVTWQQAELERARSVGTRPPKTFATRDEAAAFWRRVAGLPADAPLADDALADVLTHTPAGWRLSYDAASAALGAAPVEELVRLTPGRVVLVRGADDQLVGPGDIALAGADAALTVPGAGHSPHVERPAELVRALAGAGVLG